MENGIDSYVRKNTYVANYVKKIPEISTKNSISETWLILIADFKREIGFATFENTSFAASSTYRVENVLHTNKEKIQTYIPIISTHFLSYPSINHF